jgi:GTP-binding protein EngB required for normal cell division
MARYNVVLMGKTGVGKSTLGNYLFGNNKFKTGIGKPVTSNGFHSLEFDLQGLPVTVFDSWGIEADKADQWLSELNKELEKRSTGSDPTHWFHSVFYCVQASGHRIEDFEIKIMNKFIKENYKVTVIFTKSDNVTDDELNELKKVLSNEYGNKVDCIEVCSEEKIRRDGSVSKAFGKKELVDNIFSNFWNSISLRLPERCISIMQNEVAKWYEKQLKVIEKEAGYFNASDLYSQIKNDSKVFFDNISKGFLVVDEVNKTLKMYSLFGHKINTLSVNNYNNNFLDSITLESRSWWLYFPTNLILFAIWGKNDTENRLLKNIETIFEEMNSKIDKMLPNIEKMIAGLKPK